MQMDLKAIEASVNAGLVQIMPWLVCARADYASRWRGDFKPYRSGEIIPIRRPAADIAVIRGVNTPRAVHNAMSLFSLKISKQVKFLFY
jgi:hypothetical protein